MTNGKSKPFVITVCLYGHSDPPFPTQLEMRGFFPGTIELTTDPSGPSSFILASILARVTYLLLRAVAAAEEQPREMITKNE